MHRQYPLRMPVFVAMLAIIVGGVSAQPVGHDFNADGVPDYLAAVTNYDENMPSAGAARMWSGASKAIIDTILSAESNTLFGWSIASVGDLNNDGSDDIAVGEPLCIHSSTQTERVFMKRESRQSFIRAVLAQHVRHMDRHLNLIIPRLGSYRVQEEHSVRIRMSAQVLASLMVLVASPAISDRAAAHSIAPELRSIEGLLHAGPVADSGIYADPQVSVDTAWSLAMQRSTIELLRGYMSAQIIKQAHGMEDPGELDEWWVHTIDTNIMLLSRAWNLLESQKGHD